MTASNNLSGKAAIVGIGATEFSKDSGRSEMSLACEATLAALNDAGLSPAEVDGMSCFTAETNPEIDIAKNLGMGALTFYSRIHHGGGAAAGVVMQAAMAVATGAADVVVAYRAFNERSGHRFGTGVQDRPPAVNAENAMYSWYSPHGLLTPASWVAMFTRRYMYETGATSEDFGRVAVVSRKHAANNPAAWFYEKPITLEEHQASRWIFEPLHLFDCCQESDGGVALVITSAERARDLPNPPAVIVGAAQGTDADQEMMTSYYRPQIGIPEMGLVAEQCYRSAGIGPDDIDCAILYDAFSPMVLLTIEEFRFCGKGEGKDFVRDGHLELDGRLPTNTNGGQLGEAYIHGLNGIAEAVRQIRGTSVNQVPGAEHVLATAGTGVPTSAIILAPDR